MTNTFFCPHPEGLELSHPKHRPIGSKHLSWRNKMKQDETRNKKKQEETIEEIRRNRETR